MLLKLLLRRGVFSSYSQSGEDLVLKVSLRQKRGFYVDVGAYHPTLYSNTYAFYRRGWHGLVIDPNDSFRPLYRFLRPRDTFITAGIGSAQSSETYYRFSDASYNTFSAKNAAEYSAIPRLARLPDQTVRIIPLSTILHEQKVEHIDLLNIDVEGMDLAVLKSHDWSISTQVIAVEDRHFNVDEPSTSATYVFLREKGYVLVGMSRDTLIFSYREKQKT